MIENQPISNGRGGRRPGAGRKPGSPNKKTKEQIDAASRTGLLPHEILLLVARGDITVFNREPTPQERLDAAKAAAPYFAARRQATELSGSVDTTSGFTPEQIEALRNGDE